MRFVDEDARAVRLGHIEELVEIPEIAIHRVNALDDHELALALLPRQRRVERGGIVMLESFRRAHATGRRRRAG